MLVGSSRHHLCPGLNASIVQLVLHIWQNCVCFGVFLPKRTLCDAYHKEFESHQRSILDISARHMLKCLKTIFMSLYSCCFVAVMSGCSHCEHNNITLVLTKSHVVFVVMSLVWTTLFQRRTNTHWVGLILNTVRIQTFKQHHKNPQMKLKSSFYFWRRLQGGKNQNYQKRQTTTNT